MIYHIAAFFIGFILDLILGDPHFLPHPIRFIGSLISALDKRLNQEGNKRRCGRILVFLVLFITFILSAGILCLSYWVNPYFGIFTEAVMTYQILAVKCLRTESMKVYDRLEHGTLQEARDAVSMIVGRDTEQLTDKGVTKAAVETVAENTSDGVIAPMLYLALGGPVLGFLYKAVNTMDSMIGYKNDAYIEFGRAAAKLDDAVNYIPARLSAILMIAAGRIAGPEYDAGQAYRIWKRDRRKHASPNSAQTESVCAGALAVRLAGPASYFGKTVEKPWIGDAVREIEHEDIRRVNRLMYMTAWLCEILCILILCIVEIYF